MEKAGAGEKYELQVGRGPGAVMADPAPRFIGNFVCYEPGPNGPQVKWQEKFENMVVAQGRNHIYNVAFASFRASTDGPFMFLHNATLGSANVWTNISASVLTSLANGGTSTNFIRASFATSGTNVSDTGYTTFSTSQSFQVLSGPQTVSGAGLFFYTNTSAATNAATGDIRLYCYGSFAATQQVVSNNSISATITLQYQTA